MDKWIRVKVTQAQYEDLLARSKRERRTLTDTVWFGLIAAGYMAEPDGYEEVQQVPVQKADTTSGGARMDKSKKVRAICPKCKSTISEEGAKCNWCGEVKGNGLARSEPEI